MTEITGTDFMDIKFEPSRLCGSVEAVSSRAELQRIMIAAALCEKKTVISCNGISEEIKLTADCLNALGANVSVEEKRITVEPIKLENASDEINCGNSSLLLRFLLPVAALFGLNVKFTSSAAPISKPVIPLRNEMQSNGVKFSPPWKYPIEISGKLEAGEFNISGAMGTRYVTGLLLALPLADGDSVIHIPEKAEFKNYIDMTVEIIKSFGVEIKKENNCLYIKGRQKYISPGEITVSGDWLYSAYLLTAGAISGELSVTGLDVNTHQSEVKIIDILKSFGAEVKVEKDKVSVKKSELIGTQIDTAELDCLVPAVISLAAFCKSGLTVISNVAETRINGRNAAAVLSDCLCAVGGASTEADNGLIVWSNESIIGGEFPCFNDLKTAMLAAVTGSGSQNGITLKNAECINKLYPDFLNSLKKLGGVLNVINN